MKVWKGGRQLRGGTCKAPNCWPEILLSNRMVGKGEIIWVLGVGMSIFKRWESPSECSGLPGEDPEGRNDNFLGALPRLLKAGGSCQVALTGDLRNRVP